MSLFVFQRRGCQEVHSRTGGPFRDGGTFGVNGAAAPLKNKKKMVVWVRCYKQATPLRGLHPAVGLRVGDACKVQGWSPHSKTLRAIRWRVSCYLKRQGIEIRKPPNASRDTRSCLVPRGFHYLSSYASRAGKRGNAAHSKRFARKGCG